FALSSTSTHLFSDKQRSIAYHAFTQLLHDFYEEQGMQAFKRYDKKGDGTISSIDFQHIMTTVKKHLLTDFVRNNLIAVSGGGASGHKVKSRIVSPGRARYLESSCCMTSPLRRCLTKFLEEIFP
ncbi:hypothetical protein ANCCAN_30094, partial [Ancylostoma caninum]